MASEQNKLEAMESVAEELSQLEDYKAEMDRRIGRIYLQCGINDKPVQAGIKKAAAALVRDKMEEAIMVSDLISGLCRAKMEPMPLFGKINSGKS